MVTRTLNLSDDANEALERAAKAAGKSVDEVINELLLAQTPADFGLDEQDERAAEEGFEQLDRGEFVSEAEMRAQLKALRG